MLSVLLIYGRGSRVAHRYVFLLIFVRFEEEAGISELDVADVDRLRRFPA